jgi:hypothetical protein
LVLVGKSAFIGIIYIFQETITAAYQSLRTFIEFVITLIILYIVLGSITPQNEGKENISIKE